MSTTDENVPATIDAPMIVVPRAAVVKRFPWASVVLGTVVIPGGLWWGGVIDPLALLPKSIPPLATVAVDRGDIAVEVVESGNLESANNATVKAQVEAIVGMVGGTAKGAGGRGGAAGGGTTAAAGGAGLSGSDAAAKLANKVSMGGVSGMKTSTYKKAGGAAKSGQTGSGVAATPSGMSGGAGATAATGGGGVRKPSIKSFSMTVQAHTPLRPATTKAASKSATAKGAGGGGGGGMMIDQEKAGATRILSILPEGQLVKAGTIVAELDSATFKDELASQRIKHDQAKSWVDQAESELTMAEISLNEYKEGTLVSDRQLLKGYIESCDNAMKQAEAGYEYAKVVAAQGLYTPQQLAADEFTFAKTQLSLREARRMQDRLERYTAPRLAKNLEAKIQAVKVDVLAQRAALLNEDLRLRRLELCIEHCTMRAPRDGIVVYFVNANRWGMVQDQIREGVTVREGQSIFNLPDPTKMRVKAKINESKVSLVKEGAAVEIRIDAFPDRLMRGTVAVVAPIPAAANGPISDVKVYTAMIDIEADGSTDLKPGLSAEIKVWSEARRNVTRVPLRSVRWFDGVAFVARPAPEGKATWSALKLGVVGATFAEVLDGLAAGDRVVADPEGIAPPKVPSSTAAEPPKALAAAAAKPVG